MVKMYSKLKNSTPLISLLDSKMNTITDNIIDRDELQSNYVQEIDGLDMKDCRLLCYMIISQMILIN